MRVGGNVTGFIHSFTFYNNSPMAPVEGGAVFVDQATTLLFERCNFDSNNAGELHMLDKGSSRGGGAIFTLGKLILSTSKFRQNRAALMGGAIWTNGATNITGCEFDGNSAGFA